MYEKIAKLVELKTANIFLCGENLTDQDGFRSALYSKLKVDPNYNVIYPEWIFPDLYVNNKFNIQTLEKMLASHVDAIIIPLVSPATFAEASLFSSDDEICKKMIVLNSAEYKKSQSFINLGPLSLISTNGGKIVWYKDKEDAINQVMSFIKKLKNKEQHRNNWFYYSNVILAIITIEFPVTEDELKRVLSDLSVPTDDLSFKPAINILKRKNLILEENSFQNKAKKKVKSFRLSPSGHEHVFAPKGKTKAHKNISVMRLDQLSLRYKKHYKIQKYLENEYTSV